MYYITVEDVRTLYNEVRSRNYKFNKPGLEMAPWNALCFEVTDPFGNKLLITEEAAK